MDTARTIRPTFCTPTRTSLEWHRSMLQQAVRLTPHRRSGAELRPDSNSPIWVSARLTTIQPLVVGPPRRENQDLIRPTTRNFRVVDLHVICQEKTRGHRARSGERTFHGSGSSAAHECLTAACGPCFQQDRTSICCLGLVRAVADD
jgi:hypothetical protein